MSQRGTIFIASDYILDDPWLTEIAIELERRGMTVIRGPKQQPPARMEFARADWERYFGKADVILSSSRAVLPRPLLEWAPRLRAIIAPTAGTESIDQAAANELGIIIGNGPFPENYNSMAESTMLLMLALMYDLHGTEKVMAGNLPRPKIYNAQMMMGKTIGLIGLGKIARALVERLQGWHVRILSLDRPSRQGPPPPGVQLVPMEQLLRESDIVSLHTTLTPETRGMIGEAQLRLMKPGAYLVNTARGGMIDEQALYRALAEKRIAGAALDAFELEPLPMDHPFRTLDNVILTSHMVGHTREIYRAIPRTAYDNIARVLRDELPLYTHNPQTEGRWRQRLARLGPVTP